MSFQYYVAIKGSKQGQFKGESTNPRRNLKWIEVHDFDYPVETPTDPSSGQTSGKRQHKPVTITKEWGTASPQLFNACVTNEALTEVNVEVVDNSSNGGAETVVQTIKLTNALIVGRRPHTGHAAAGGGNLTEFNLTFQKIVVSGVNSKSNKDSW